MDGTQIEAARLERQLVWLRWLVAAFGAVQVGFAVRDRGNDPAFALPLAVALVIGLAIGNLAISSSVRKATEPGQFRSIGVVAFALDAVVILGLVWLVPSGPGDPVWVLGYLVPLEGAARWGLPGGLIGAGLFLGEQIVQEAARAQVAAGASQVSFRAGMAFVIGAVTGSFVSSLQRTAAEAADQAIAASAAAQRAEVAASQAAEAHREVAAFHAAVFADAQPEHLAETLRATAGRVAAELGCTALGLLTRSTGIAGEDVFTVAGVHGDPGYLLGQAAVARDQPGGGGRGRRGHRGGGGRRRRADARAWARRRRGPRARRHGARCPAGGRAADDRGSTRCRPGGHPASRRAGRHRRSTDGARCDEDGLRRDHEPRAPDAAGRDPGVRRHAPATRRRPLRGRAARVPRDRADPDRAIDPSGRRPARRLPGRGRRAGARARGRPDPPAARPGRGRPRRAAVLVSSSKRWPVHRRR